MANRIQLRRGNTSEWTNANPILAQGEIGIDLDQNRIKIGDGSTPWNSLAYERPDDQSSNIPNTLVKRDQSGNFSANAITAALVGNASSASQLANARQISLTGDVNGANSFDGSANMTITATLATQANVIAGTYTKLTVNDRGLVTTAANPTTLAGYNITDGQLENNFLTALSGLHSQSLNGYVVKVNNTTTGSVVREIIGTAGRIQQTGDSTGITNNTIFDLIPTGVSAAYSGGSSLYFDAGNTQQSKIFNAPNQESNTSTNTGLKMTVDVWGRLTQISEHPIVTAYEGTKAAAFSNSATYLRYTKVTSGGRLYEAGYGGVSSGQGAPTHTDGTKTGGWWDLGVAETPVKGLASFDQEDFDVDSAGHVTIADKGIDNTQLQNTVVGFADGNTLETFQLDSELTASTGYRGFNYLNYVKVNDTSGNLLVGANNTGDGGSGELDVNVRSYFSDPDITLDGTSAQTLDKTGDGNLTFQLTQNSASIRNLSIISSNAGSGDSRVTITAENLVNIYASDSNGNVAVENTRFKGSYIGTNVATMNLDPGDDRAATGTVRIWGDLQVDGTTTTVNSTTVTIDDPVFTLGGDTDPASDDDKDRGIEFRYYNSGAARRGFFGWDDSSEKYRFLNNATNTSEVFSGTDSGLLAGNLTLSSNIASSSSSTGTLIVTGGAGISEDLYIGQNLNVTGTGQFSGQLTVIDTLLVRAFSEEFAIQNGSSVDKFTVQTDTGNTLIEGTLNVNGATTLTDDLIINVANKEFAIQNGSGADQFTVDTDNGNTRIQGFIDVEGNIFQQSAPGTGSNTIASDTSFLSDVTLVNNGGTHTFEIRDGVSGAKFTVTGSSGNTDIQGTLDVNGATTITNSLSVSDDVTVNTNKFSIIAASGNTSIAGTLNVTDDVSLSSDLTVTGAATVDGNATFNGSTTTIGNSNTDTLTAPGQIRFTSTDGQSTTQTYTADGAVRISGGVAIDENLAVQNDLYVYGDLNTTGDQVINGTTTYNARLTIQNTAQASSFNDNTVSFRTRGGAVVEKRLFVGDDFYVWDDSNARSAFYVDNSNGNADLYGDLDIRSQNILLESNGDITHVGNYILNGANKSFIIQNGSSSNQFVVDADNGNTDIQGTLDVAGATEIDDTLTVTGQANLQSVLAVTGNMTVNSNRFSVNASNGNTSILGTLDVGGTADITGATTIDGATTINNDLTLAGGTSDLTVGGNATISGNLTVNGTTTTISSTVISVDDKNIELGAVDSPTDTTADGGGLTLKGTSDKTFNWVNSTDSWTSSEHLDIESSKQLKHGGTEILSPTKQLKNITDITSTGDVSFAGGNFTVAQITGNTVVGGTLSVTGSISLTGLTATTGTFSGAVSSGGNFSVGSTNFTVNATSGNTSILGSLTVTGATTLSSSTSVTGNVTASGDVAVNGGDLTTTSTGTATLFNSNATTVNIGGDASAISMGSAVNSLVTVNDDLAVTSNLTVSGTGSFTGVTNVGSVITMTPTVGSRSVVVGTAGSSATFTAYGNVTLGFNSSSTVTTTGSVDVGTSLTVGSTLTSTGNITAPVLVSNVAQGTAPLTVGSNTVVSNLNADLLDGQEGAYYAAAQNTVLSGTPTAPTAAQTTNTTQIATTAYVQSNLTATLLRAALGITEAAADPADGRGMYFNTTDNEYQLST